MSEAEDLKTPESEEDQSRSEGDTARVNELL
jgi:hypothetical protein